MQYVDVDTGASVIPEAKSHITPILASLFRRVAGRSLPLHLS